MYLQTKFLVNILNNMDLTWLIGENTNKVVH